MEVKDGWLGNRNGKVEVEEDEVNAELTSTLVENDPTRRQTPRGTSFKSHNRKSKAESNISRAGTRLNPNDDAEYGIRYYKRGFPIWQGVWKRMVGFA